MHDLVIRAGSVVDGTGAPSRTADIAIDGDQIVAVGKVDEAGRAEIDADGALVTPGFVDVHTHYDGQASWDDVMAPSVNHGVTTAVMGNCGVGFAPVRPDSRTGPATAAAASSSLSSSWSTSKRRRPLAYTGSTTGACSHPGCWPTST